MPRAAWVRCGAAAVALCGAAGMASGCTAGVASPRPSPTGTAQTPGPLTGAARRALAARYLAIAKAGNRGLDTAFSRLNGTDRHSLAASAVDLRHAAAIERTFDRQLRRIVFPGQTETTAEFLVYVNQERAALTSKAAQSRSLSQLRAYERRMAAANRPVEQAVGIIRHELGLPPPAAS